MFRKSHNARAGSCRASLYDDITGKIIVELQAGRAPWVQPWGSAAAKAPLAMPRNAATGRHYSGINVLILWGAVIQHGFPGQSWLTFRQALSLGGNVRKGEHGTTVVYADRFTPEDEKRRARETGEDAAAIRSSSASPSSMPRNATACRRTSRPSLHPSARPHRTARRDPDPGNRHRLPHRRRPRLLCAGTRLCAGAAAAGLFRADQLAPHGPARTGARHRPHVPARPRPDRRFRHEEIRLRRVGGRDQRSLLLCLLGITPTVRHADYIGSWLEVLREDNRAIVRAASQASKAADWLLGLLPEAELGSDVGSADDERQAA
jgi:hypothetical protein